MDNRFLKQKEISTRIYEKQKEQQKRMELEEKEKSEKRKEIAMAKQKEISNIIQKQREQLEREKMAKEEKEEGEISDYSDSEDEEEEEEDKAEKEEWELSDSEPEIDEKKVIYEDKNLESKEVKEMQVDVDKKISELLIESEKKDSLDIKKYNPNMQFVLASKTEDSMIFKKFFIFYLLKQELRKTLVDKLYNDFLNLVKDEVIETSLGKILDISTFANNIELEESEKYDIVKTYEKVKQYISEHPIKTAEEFRKYFSEIEQIKIDFFNFYMYNYIEVLNFGDFDLNLCKNISDYSKYDKKNALLYIRIGNTIYCYPLLDAEEDIVKNDKLVINNIVVVLNENDKSLLLKKASDYKLLNLIKYDKFDTPEKYNKFYSLFSKNLEIAPEFMDILLPDVKVTEKKEEKVSLRQQPKLGEKCSEEDVCKDSVCNINTGKCTSLDEAQKLIDRRTKRREDIRVVYDKSGNIVSYTYSQEDPITRNDEIIPKEFKDDIQSKTYTDLVLSNKDMSGSKIFKVVFSNCDIKENNFSNSRFTFTKFLSKDLPVSVISNDFSNSIFTNCEFTNVNFYLSNFTNCEFRFCKFNSCDFNDSIMSKVVISDSEFVDSNLHQAKGLDDKSMVSRTVFEDKYKEFKTNINEYLRKINVKRIVIKNIKGEKVETVDRYRPYSKDFEEESEESKEDKDIAKILRTKKDKPEKTNVEKREELLADYNKFLVKYSNDIEEIDRKLELLEKTKKTKKISSEIYSLKIKKSDLKTLLANTETVIRRIKESDNINKIKNNISKVKEEFNNFMTIFFNLPKGKEIKYREVREKVVGLLKDTYEKCRQNDILGYSINQMKSDPQPNVEEIEKYVNLKRQYKKECGQGLEIIKPFLKYRLSRELSSSENEKVKTSINSLQQIQLKKLDSELSDSEKAELEELENYLSDKIQFITFSKNDYFVFEKIKYVTVLEENLKVLEGELITKQKEEAKYVKDEVKPQLVMVKSAENLEMMYRKRQELKSKKGKKENKKDLVKDKEEKEEKELAKPEEKEYVEEAEPEAEEEEREVFDDEEEEYTEYPDEPYQSDVDE